MINLTIKISKKSIKKEIVDSIFPKNYVVDEDENYYICSQNDSDIEIFVRKSESPLLEKNDAVYVDSWKKVKMLFDLNSDCGISKLINLQSSEQLKKELDLRLYKIYSLIKSVRSVYIFSAHLNGRKIIDYCKLLNIKILGFIDNDLNKINKSFEGYPVFGLDSINKNSIIINGSGRYAEEIDKQLTSIGYKNKIGFMEFLYLFNLPFQAHNSFSEFVEGVFKYKYKLISLYLSLNDKLSRIVLDNFLLYKMTLMFGFINKTTSPYDEEFFAKDLLYYGESEVFVDCGAYNGDSFLRFNLQCKEFTKAYLFEPDNNIAKIASQSFADDSRVVVVNSGVFSETKELRFSATGKMNGAISDQGQNKINVVDIDNFIKEPISHIKLDVEGAEAEALIGSKNKIQKNLPKIAVAVYHKPNDLVVIPSLIESFKVGSYSFSLRHYSETLDDLILYALPVNSNYEK